MEQINIVDQYREDMIPLVLEELRGIRSELNQLNIWLSALCHGRR